MIRFPIAILLLFLWSCIPDQNNITGTSEEFYDINGLIDQQIKILDSISPSVLKKAIIGEDEEIQKDDSVVWINELLIFRSADINKPILKDSYDISIAENDESHTINYSSKSPKSTAVDKLSIETIGSDQNPLKILASINSQNPLFGSVVHMELHFQNLDGNYILAKYKTQGWQKMISKDSTHYSIESEVLLN